MKKISFLVVLCLCLITGAKAQNSKQYERKDFSFKITKEKNADNYVNKVNLSTYVGSQLINKYTYEVLSPLPEDMSEQIGHISEDDINFDGYPDISIYLGNIGGGANNTQNEALLWNQAQHGFVKPEGYDEIGEPQLDSKTKTIFTVTNTYEDVTKTYYRWDGNQLVEYLSETAKIEDAKVIDFSGMLNLPLHRFDAKLNGKTSVIIAFQKDADGIVAGYIYYPRAKNPAPILIVGSYYNNEGMDGYFLHEYQSDGSISGTITLEDSKNNGWSGTWTNPKTHKELKISDAFYSHKAAKWFTKSLLTPESPDNIGHEYAFQIWNQAYQSMMGGTITFRAAGKNKVHFECLNACHNIAEGKSAANRPAVLKNNVFEYSKVNDCDYGFRATFFPRFVVLKTTSPDTNCFGMGASFDGVYIKTKK